MNFYSDCELGKIVDVIDAMDTKYIGFLIAYLKAMEEEE